MPPPGATWQKFCQAIPSLPPVVNSFDPERLKPLTSPSYFEISFPLIVILDAAQNLVIPNTYALRGAQGDRDFLKNKFSRPSPSLGPPCRPSGQKTL